MISRRDNILKRPWELRRYESHLRKVQTAVPRIDNNPPVTRNHVAIKLKKKQKDDEKCTRIERENLILLRKLNSIMQKNERETFWKTPPKVSGRVQLFNPVGKQQRPTTSVAVKPSSSTGRRSCYACNPELQKSIEEPQERIPWELPRKPMVQRFRSKSVPANRVSKLATVQEQSDTSTPSDTKVAKRSTSSRSRNYEKDCRQPPESIIFSRGALVLSVHFPSDTAIKYQSGKSTKILQTTTCYCRNWIKT